MERNIGYPAGMVDAVQVRVGSAQVELLCTDSQEVQAVIAGDARSAGELIIRHENGKLCIEQPQYGVLNFSSKWLQIGLRLPQQWSGNIGVTTISGAISVKGIQGGEVNIDTVSGTVHADSVRCQSLTMNAVSGTLLATRVSGRLFRIRSVSSAITLFEADFETIKTITASGQVSLDFACPFRTLEIQAATGDIRIQVPGGRAEVAFRSVAGKLTTEDIREEEGAPKVQVTTITGNVRLASEPNETQTGQDADRS